MLLGLQLHSYYPSAHGNHFDTTMAVVQACERAGLDSVWAADHLMFRTDHPMVQGDHYPGEQVPLLEAFVLLGAIAASTTWIRIGELVAGVPFRNPALLAKLCATLDVASHGRSIVGLGAGWHEPEFAAYGWPFPSARARLEMLEEAVQIIDQLLTHQPVTFLGKHYTVREAYNEPPPVQRPRPPIMIGGSGERVTLRIVAQYADMCNLFGDPPTVARRLDVLRQHCAAVGRPFEAITRTNAMGVLIARDAAELAAKRARYPRFGGFAGTPDEVVARLRAYADAGSQYVILGMPDAGDIEPLLVLGETVVPAVAAL